MPFDGSYIDHEKSRYQDSQEYLVDLARKIIRDPLTTHVIPSHTPSGKRRFLVVDKTRTPEEGDIAVLAGEKGIRCGRLKGKITSKGTIIWGKVTWILEEE